MKPNMFKELFLAEARTLAGGRRPKRLLSLFAIFFLTLFALGTNNGLMSYLTARMDSPYLRLIAIPSYVNGKTLTDAEIDLDQYGVESRFMLAGGYVYVGYQGKALESATKVIASESPEFIVQCILDAQTSALISANASFEKDAHDRSSVIISQNLAEALNYSEESGFPYIEFFHAGLKPEEGDRGILLPVAGIVSSLPEDASVYMTKDILAWLKEASESPARHLANPNYIDYNAHHHFVAETDTDRLRDFEAAGYHSSPAPTHVPGKVFRVGTKPVEGMTVVHVFPSEAVTSKAPAVASFAEYLVFSADHSKGQSSLEAFAEEVRKFNSSLDPGDTGIELDLNSIETRKNLDIIERLSYILTSALSLLAVLFVMSQTMSMLMMHLERNKRNLGTLKAFGTSNGTILKVYGGISLVIMSGAFLVAWLLNVIVGTPLLLAIARLTGLNATSAELSFDQWNVAVLALIFVGLPMVRVVIAIRKRLSNATPGDLIYDRSHE
jgi:hypothetical protein